MSNFETAPYRLASAINDLAGRVLELEAFDNAIFEIKTTTGRPTARGNYHFVINTFDDTVEIYADGAWEDLIGAGGGGYTDEEAQDAIGTIWIDTATTNFTYTDATPEMKIDVIPGGVDHDSLLNFVANEHIDHTSVTLTAGAGLTGGGTIAANRTFNIGAGTGITVNADDIQTNDGAIDHDSLLNFVANEHIDHTSVTLTAGTHLSGGGDISANRTFDVDDDFILNTGDIMEGTLIIDDDNVEAFLVRKDGDAGDIFIVDTTNSDVNLKQLTFIDGGSSVDIIRDEDNMVSDDANALATQQSIKAYVDSQAGGYVDTSGVPVANDYARFTDADTIEGRSYAEAVGDLDGAADWDYADHDLHNMKQVDFQDEHAGGNSSTSITIDWNEGNNWAVTMTGNCTFSFTNPAGPCHCQLKLTQDGTGSRTAAFTGGGLTVLWPGGTAVTLSTGAADVDIISFWFDGTNWYGVGLLDFS